MRREIEYISIDGLPGGNQDWFSDRMMKLGGCAAVCACDSSIYFAKFLGKTEAYPFDAAKLLREDYIAFSKLMKPYLRPRWSGIDKPQIFLDGFGKYLSDRGVTGVAMTALPGDSEASAAAETVKKQIDALLPVPCLILSHKNKEFGDYEWHWFMLTGYDNTCEFLVKTVTYSEERWISLEGLWDTGCTQKGGLIIYNI